ncbi:hypothetical protein, partial [Bacillus pseudomycoides]|uniref:hypothetical protein n=1 Tax=Bacillus pseudomycoides TaxID=64104 RepID=UPI001C3F26F5
INKGSRYLDKVTGFIDDEYPACRYYHIYLQKTFCNKFQKPCDISIFKFSTPSPQPQHVKI